MAIHDFKSWCEQAVSGIRFPPDREMVSAELMDHLQDHYADLLSQGVDADAARQMALAAMGSPEAIAPQLAAIHRPFWGWLLRITRVMLALALCAALWCTWAGYTPYRVPREVNAFQPYTETFHQSLYSDRTRLFHAAPDQSVRCDGYTLTLTQAAVWHESYLGQQISDKERDYLYFQIEVFNPRPWAEHSDVSGWFWAVDSLGNTYDSDHKHIQNYTPYITGSVDRTGPLTTTHDMWISDYRSLDAEWIEFHYDRSGRDLVFRLDLTGGDAQ